MRIYRFDLVILAFVTAAWLLCGTAYFGRMEIAFNVTHQESPGVRCSLSTEAIEHCIRDWQRETEYGPYKDQPALLWFTASIRAAKWLPFIWALSALVMFGGRRARQRGYDARICQGEGSAHESVSNRRGARPGRCNDPATTGTDRH